MYSSVLEKINSIFFQNFPELRNLFDVGNLMQLYTNLNSEQFMLSFLYQPTVELVSDNNLVLKTTLKPHDAGSDSLATGTVFIKLLHAVVMQSKRKPIAAPVWIEYMGEAKQFVNRVNLIRAHNHSMVICVSNFFT